MKNVLKILSGVVIVGLIIILIIKSQKKEKPFKNVELSGNNKIININLPKYYDTIISVGLDGRNIKNQTIILKKINDNAVNSMEGIQIDAHLRYEDSTLYLFSGEFGRDKSIEIISHEIIHMEQYLNNDIQYNNGILIYKNKSYNLNDVNYEVRPWEVDAHNKQGEVITHINKVLY